MIEIKFDSAQVLDVLRRLQRSVADASPVMAQIAGVMHDAVEENFAQQGRPKWLGLKAPVSKRRSGGMILQDSGQLAASITQASDATSATVGTNKVYAAIHQFGGQTRPHVILPRNKKALAFGGRVVKKVNHPGSKIPARPFLSLTPDDEERIVGKVGAYLKSVIG